MRILFTEDDIYKMGQDVSKEDGKNGNKHIEITNESLFPPKSLDDGSSDDHHSSDEGIGLSDILTSPASSEDGLVDNSFPDLGDEGHSSDNAMETVNEVNGNSEETSNCHSGPEIKPILTELVITEPVSESDDSNVNISHEEIKLPKTNGNSTSEKGSDYHTSEVFAKMIIDHVIQGAMVQLKEEIKKQFESQSVEISPSELNSHTKDSDGIGSDESIALGISNGENSGDSVAETGAEPVESSADSEPEIETNVDIFNEKDNNLVADINAAISDSKSESPEAKASLGVCVISTTTVTEESVPTLMSPAVERSNPFLENPCIPLDSVPESPIPIDIQAQTPSAESDRKDNSTLPTLAIESEKKEAVSIYS